MDDRALDAAPSAVTSEGHVVAIDGVAVASFSLVVNRLSLEYPEVPATRIETILLREWEAFTAGRPLVVPVAIEEGVREVLDQRLAEH